MDLNQLQQYLAENTNFGALERKLRKENPQLHAEIKSSWTHTQQPKSFLEVVYQFFNPTEITCPYGNVKRFEYYRTGYVCKKSCQCSYDKKRATMLERHGVEHALQKPELLDKARATWQDKYGVSKLSEINTEQKQQTNLAKYGAAYPLQSASIQQRIDQTNVERYGHARPFGNADVQTRAVETMQERYGVKNSRHMHKDPAKVAAFADAVEFVQVYAQYDRVSALADYFGVDPSSIARRAKQLGLPVKQNNISDAELELAEFLAEHVPIVQSNRSILAPKEIDILIESANIGIEYNGLYYHSLQFRDNMYYHLNKTEAAIASGIELIHIFSDEWTNKTDIVKSRLLNKIGKSPVVIYGRKCKIVTVASDVATAFLNENHIQGSCFSKHNLALEHNGEIVALMTFGKARFTRRAQWELLRFCTKRYTSVVGAASKLLKHFRQQQPGSIVSYADRRWSTGNLYKKLGFVFSHNSAPGYFYVVNDVRETRYKYQKHKLASKLDNFDPALSEEQNMANNGFYRIYDCGNSVWYLN